MNLVVFSAIGQRPRGLLEEGNIASLNWLLKHELQPTGLVAVLDGVGKPDRLVETIISKCLILDWDLTIHNTLGEVLPSNDILRVSCENSLVSTFRVVDFSAAYAWTQVSHIMERYSEPLMQTK